MGKEHKALQKQVRERIRELLEEIERVNEAEEEEYGDQDLPEVGESAEIDSQRLKEKIDQLNERLRKHPKDRNLKKAVHRLQKDYLPRLEKYEDQEKKLSGRSSYSKTDEEATFLRMKEDQRNPSAWPRPAYNVQLGTENQFIVGFSVHQQANDAICLKPHLEEVEQYLGRLPKNWVGDGSYGTEENLAFAEEKQSNAYLKYPTFHQESKAKYRGDPFRAENFAYDSTSDCFTCPRGRLLPLDRVYVRTTQTGFPLHTRRYLCSDCSGCPFKAQCTRGVGNRYLTVSWNNWRLKEMARQLLSSKKGVKLRSRRGWQVEGVFGHIKYNRNFRRFMLRGLRKVRTEMGLLALAHNWMKLAAV